MEDLRPFEKLNEQEKLLQLFQCVYLVFQNESIDTLINGNDYLDLAIEYGGKRLQLKREDFDLIRNLTIDDISKKIFQTN